MPQSIDHALTDFSQRAFGAFLRFRLGIEILLSVFLIWLLSALIWTIISPTQRQILQERALPTPLLSPAEDRLNADRTRLVSLNPFEAGAVQSVAAPETNLNLNLEGLFMSTNGSLGSASIRLPDNQTRLFRPGDEVLDGVYLETVLSDRVVLNRNGVQETLLKFGRTSGLSVLDQTPSAIQPSSVEQIGTAEEIKGQAKDPQTLLLGLEIALAQEGGEPIGYRIMPRGSLSIMASAGLMPGDIVTKIDNTSVIGDVEADLVARLQGKQEVAIEVQRGNTPRIIRLNFSG